MIKLRLVSLLVVASFLLPSVPTFACAFGTDTIFDYTTHPDLPLKNFAAGQLGILNSNYARSYLIPAYRYLSGSPLSSSEQQAMVSLWDQRLDTSWVDYSADTSAWLAARKLIADAPKLDSITTTRSVADGGFSQYCNCQTPAFQLAAATLKDRIAKYGNPSPAVEGWLKAQDTVFSNCEGPSWDQKVKAPAIPADLPGAADLQQKQDRAYQIAAANFYSQQWDPARKQFEAIAADAASPWKQISGYLAVRCLIRQAMLGKDTDMKLLSEANAKLKTLIADPSYGSMLPDLESLKSYTLARLSPSEHVEELSARLSKNIARVDAEEMTKTIDLLLGDKDQYDVTMPEYGKLPEALKKTELVDWIMDFQSSDAPGKAHAVARWKETQSVPWLVAALSKITASDSETPGLLDAAAKVPQSSPAYWTLFYLTNGLKAESGKAEDVRAALDKVLSAPPADLPLSAKNALSIMRLRLSDSLAGFVRFGILRPVCLCSSGGIAEVPDDLDTVEKSGKSVVNAPMFTEDGGYLLDLKFPLSILEQLAEDKSVPANLRGNIAWTAWVRAVLISDEAAGRKLAVTLNQYNKKKVPLLNSYLAATTPETRKFAAAFLMLQFSSAQPNSGWGPQTDDGYGDASGWWWGPKPVAGYSNPDMSNTTFKAFTPVFLTAQQKTQAESELAKLAKVQGAPDYFAGIVLPFAKAHPADPRVPQALHELVKATRYGTTSDATAGYSKQAFTLLHSAYKTSPWAKQTPYWY